MRLTKKILENMILDEMKNWKWAKHNCYVERREEEQKMEKDKKTKEDKPVSITTIVRVCDLKKVPVN
jgi:hypothetical protein